MYKKITNSPTVLTLHHIPIGKIEQIKKRFLNGEKYYNLNENDLALEEFKFVLKNLPFTSSPKSISSKILEYKYELLGAIYLLGKIYLKSTSFFNNYTKAAGIFQYGEKFSKIHEVKFYNENNKVDFLKEAYLVEEIFISSIQLSSNKRHISQESYLQYKTVSELYKSNLSKIRCHLNEQISEISQFSMHDIHIRSRAVENIYEDCSKFLVSKTSVNGMPLGFINQLIYDCFNLIGNPPLGCTYAIIGLGSLAGGKMTPWSDLEFAILINENNEEHKEYFRKIIKLLHLKIVNIGETPLRTLGIKELNNFQSGNKSDDWFTDDITYKGFMFDSSSLNGCKTPFGRKGYENKKDYELILTPKEMASFQRVSPEGHDWFESDPHLVQALRNFCLIEGDQNILDNYIRELSLSTNHAAIKKRAIEILKEDLKTFELKLGDEEEGKLIDVKKDIFRIADRLINDLVFYYQIEPDNTQQNFTAWNALDIMSSSNSSTSGFKDQLKLSEIKDNGSRKRPLELNEERILSEVGAKHLKEALSIACELRFCTYYHNMEQTENMSTYYPATSHLSESQTQKFIEDTFYIQGTDLLHHFYYIILRLQQILKKFCNDTFIDEAKIILRKDDLIDTSDYMKAKVHCRFLEYDQAVKYMEQSYLEHRDDTDFLIDMYLLYLKTSKFHSAIQIIQSVLTIQNNLKIESNKSNQAATYNDLGNAYQGLENYDLAIDYYNNALAIYTKIYNNTYNSPIARIYHNLSSAYLKKENYEFALSNGKKALEIKQSIYSNNNASVGKTYANIGNIFQVQKDYPNALLYYNTALEIFKQAYKKQPNHPLIGKIYGNIGTVYQAKKDYKLAIENYEFSLEIYDIIYRNCPNHESIANIHFHLAYAYFIEGIYEESIKTSYKALTIYSELQDANENEDIIKCKQIYEASLFQLGNLAFLEGKTEEARKYYKILDSNFDDRNIEQFVTFIEGQRSILYNLHSGVSAINCQLVLLEIDPDLKFGNHYHNLASFYSCRGEIINALDAYNKALDRNVCSSLYVDYAQFLILNSNNLMYRLPDVLKKISDYLHKAIKLDDGSMLQYKKIHKYSISPLLKEIMEQTKSTLQINPKSLAYYFLIKYKVFRNNEDNLEKLFELFCAEINSTGLQNISKTLLSDLGVCLESLTTEHDDFQTNLSRQASYQSSAAEVFSQCHSNAGNECRPSQILSCIDESTQETEVVGNLFYPSQEDHNKL